MYVVTHIYLLIANLATSPMSILVFCRYLWYSVHLLPRFTLPLLSLIHGYSLWKLHTEKEQVAMKWDEEEDQAMLEMDPEGHQTSSYT